MWFFNLNKSFVAFISSTLLIFFGFSLQGVSAEVFQISNSSTLQIGDQNRIYKVEIACLDVDRENEDLAVSWLKSQLPRHSRVNLKPMGYKDGSLLAKVIKLNSNNDIGTLMQDEGIAKVRCPK
ncbi:hypothetical protein [Prochlorococcus marinus]|uniref:Nuclease n=1 Tax=Prochlorococcus marinus (strain MIT 9211) TaxID=93059 RepID=A9BEF1_PROM4|nr:hypothetical protein [Prochlorococcus marinus]ABX08461.1 conserved hypothetical protein [Prochlorococcus marinus str. MIT 9211]